MNKLKNYIRNKMMDFLGINELVNLFDKYIDTNDNTFQEINRNMYKLNTECNNKISHFQDSVNVLHSTVENVVHIGTDVRHNTNEHSWAVVCVEGKMNIVKFVSLERKDGIHMLDFLKQFEAGKHCIDTPYKEIFNNGLFKF